MDGSFIQLCSIAKGKCVVHRWTSRTEKHRTCRSRTEQTTNVDTFEKEGDSLSQKVQIDRSDAPIAGRSGQFIKASDRHCGLSIQSLNQPKSERNRVIQTRCEWRRKKLTYETTKVNDHDHGITVVETTALPILRFRLKIILVDWLCDDVNSA